MPAGRHFLQIPGPSNVPDRILRAMDYPTMDHRGPAFADVGRKALEGMKRIFKTAGRVVIYPSSGTGAWEAALVNTLSPGDTVLMYETGHFATLWKKLAEKLGLNPVFIEGDWRSGADAAAIEEHLRGDKGKEVKAVCVVHNETSTGSVTDVAAVRRAIDAVGHSALLMVDTISSLASVDYRHDEWGVDVTVAGSQKGLMLPPGLSFNAVSNKAMKASESAGLIRSYWSWAEMAGPNDTGYLPYTPATNLLYGLNRGDQYTGRGGARERLPPACAARRAAARAAVEAWGLEVLCNKASDRSPVLTAVMVPEGHSADNFRAVTLRNYDMSLGNGLSKVADRVFRIGHLGDFNDLMLIGTLGGVEMGLRDAGVPYRAGGVQAAMAVLGQTGPANRAAA
ncbi:MAG: aminotransferase class V-fold PLP-dependent enzyme [Roseovarius sp.]|nr:aminotransferase class V-fold PLP-dependent enzyme [Roseovarius sp.]